MVLVPNGRLWRAYGTLVYPCYDLFGNAKDVWRKAENTTTSNANPRLTNAVNEFAGTVYDSMNKPLSEWYLPPLIPFLYHCADALVESCQDKKFGLKVG